MPGTSLSFTFFQQKAGVVKLPAGKSVIRNFLGTGMISVMPVLLLLVNHLIQISYCTPYLPFRVFFLVWKSIKQPIRNINNPHSLVLILIVPSAGDNHLRVSIPNLKQGGHFTFKSLVIADIVRYLYINLLIAFNSNKVNLFLVEYADIDLISSTEQLYRNHVFKYSAVVHIFCAELGIAESMVAQIILIVAGQILFAFNIISADFIKGKGIAQILNIRADRNMVDFFL